MIDYVIVDSEWCVEMFPKGLVYQGEFLKIGAPRCDSLFANKIQVKKQLKKRIGLEKIDNLKIVMYAPTFREKSQNGKRKVFSEGFTLDFERLLQILKEKFGGEWYLCMRLHPQLAVTMKAEMKDRMVDVSQDDDIYNILPAIDALITDYSSIAMDASFGNIPVFIYADDIEQYIRDRGSFLWNIPIDLESPITNNEKMTPGIHTILPYTIAQNNGQLEEQIRQFQYEKYIKNLTKFKKDVGLICDGKASIRAANEIERLLER